MRPRLTDEDRKERWARAEWLEEYRRSRKLSYREMAEVLKVSTTTAWRVEKALTTPPPAMLLKLQELRAKETAS